MSDLRLLHAPDCASYNDISLPCTCPRSHWSSQDAADEAAESQRDTMAAFFAASALDIIRSRVSISADMDVALREAIRRSFVAGWDEARRHR